MVIKDYKEMPCDTCVHSRVCTVRKQFEETEVKTTHPYINVILECTEYLKSASRDKDMKGRAV